MVTFYNIFVKCHMEATVRDVAGKTLAKWLTLMEWYNLMEVKITTAVFYSYRPY